MMVPLSRLFSALWVALLLTSAASRAAAQPPGEATSQATPAAEENSSVAPEQASDAAAPDGSTDDDAEPDDEPSTSALSRQPAAASDGNQETSAEDAAATPVELPEGYQEEFNKRVKVYEDLQRKLAEAITRQRAIQIRYVNGLIPESQARETYYQSRDEVRELFDELYLKALDILRIGAHQPSATFMVTWIQNRFEHDQYDVSTLEGAVRLIDGGARLTYLFQVAARSAVALGDFDLAKRLLETIDDENMEEIDETLEFHLEDYRASWEKEAEIREREAEEDRLPRVKFETTRGDFVVELFIDQAPSTVSNFIQLVEDDFYDNNDFLQVIDHMLALTGDPSGTGTGNSGRYIADEHTRPDARDAFRGSLVMAKLPQDDKGAFVPNTASSQFAILYLPMLSASHQQTVFGRVIEGMDVVSRLRRVDPSEEKKKETLQMPPDRIIKATVLRRPDELPPVQYVDPGHRH